MGGSGSGGHNRKPAYLHRLHGTYRKDRHGKVIPAGEPASVKPPTWLPPLAKRFWKENYEALTELGTLDKLSEPLYAVLCSEWAHLREMEKEMRKDGIMPAASRGAKKVHPLHAAYIKSSNNFAKLASDLGLTPAGRRRLGVESPKPAKEENPFTSFGTDFPDRRG